MIFKTHGFSLALTLCCLNTIAYAQDSNKNELKQENATPGNYLFNIKKIELQTPQNDYVNQPAKKCDNLPKNKDLSCYDSKNMLIGYPYLISDADKIYIFKRPSTPYDLKYNMRAVNSSYGDVTVENAEKTARKLKESGVNTVLSGGNRSIYKNLDKNIKNSSIVRNACHKYGINFVHHLTTTMVDAEYQKKNPQYSCIDISKGGPYFNAYGTFSLCLNNDEFWKEYMGYLEKLFKNVRMDGIMIDEIEFWGDNTCWCESCKNKFKNETGFELPPSSGKEFSRNLSNKAYKTWLAWRAKKLQERNIQIKGLMQKYMPDGGFYPTYLCAPTMAGTNNAFYTFGMRIDEQIKFSNSIGLEFEPGGGGKMHYYYNWPVAIAVMKYVKAANRTLSANPWLYSYPSDYGDYIWCWLFAMTFGFNEWFPGEANPPEIVQAARTPIMQWMAKYQDLIGNTSSTAETAILFSCSTRDFSPDGITWRVGYMGVCQLLADAHIPYQVVLDGDINDDILRTMKILVLFNTQCLSQGAINAITDFVKNGGTLIASGKVSINDENGNARKDFGLKELLGVSYDNYVNSTQNNLIPTAYAQKEFKLITKYSHDKSFVKLKNIKNDSLVLGQIIDTNKSEYPGIILRNYEKGKVFYFSGHPELHYIKTDHIAPNKLPIGNLWTEKRNYNYLDMIQNIIEHINPKPSLLVKNLPEGVVAEAYNQKSSEIEGIAVHVANFSGANFREGVLPKNFEFSFPPVIPPDGIGISVKDNNNDIEKVYLISPDYGASTIELPLKIENGYANTKIPALYRYMLVYFLKKGENRLKEIANGEISNKIPEPVEMITRKEDALAGKYSDSDILIWGNDPKISGGFWNNRGIGCGARTLYGTEGSYSSMKIEFNLEKQPKRLYLTITGAEIISTDGKIDAIVNLNDKNIFNSCRLFEKGEEISLKTFDIDPQILRQGKNEIEIKNMSHGQHLRPPNLRIILIKLNPEY